MVINGKLLIVVLSTLCALSIAAGSTAVVRTYTNDVRIGVLEKSDVHTVELKVAVAEKEIEQINGDIKKINEDVRKIKTSQHEIESKIEDIEEHQQEQTQKLDLIIRRLPR